MCDYLNAFTLFKKRRSTLLLPQRGAQMRAWVNLNQHKKNVSVMLCAAIEYRSWMHCVMAWSAVCNFGQLSSEAKLSVLLLKYFSVVMITRIGITCLLCVLALSNLLRPPCSASMSTDPLLTPSVVTLRMLRIHTLRPLRTSPSWVRFKLARCHEKCPILQEPQKDDRHPVSLELQSGASL